MKKLLPFLLLLFTAVLHAQTPWSTFLDPSRAIDWTSAGFTVPSYTVPCSTQPSLLTGSGNAAANTTAIQNALASCDATHNVVNVPAGTYYVATWQYPAKGFAVVRGAGGSSTFLIATTNSGYGGLNGSVGMISSGWTYSGAANVQPGGSNACTWATGYAQGSTTLTFTSCGSAPPLHKMIILDQANDSSDNGGAYVCNENTAASCNYDGTGAAYGRLISGISHSQEQVTYVTGVTSTGGSNYTVTISPGVYFSNIRSGQSPGVWWSDITQNNGLENLTLTPDTSGNYTVVMFDCYHCWVKGVSLPNGGRASVTMYQSMGDVIRDSYFYGAQNHASVSYNIESQNSSAYLVENNIMQQTTTPMTVNNGTGGVIDYNFAVDSTTFAGYSGPIFSSHDSANSFNLWEGNAVMGFMADNAWGSPTQQTYFRNSIPGWSKNGSAGNNNTSISLRSYARAFNFVGNVMGQPSYSTAYIAHATSTTAYSGNANASIYDFGAGVAANTCGTGTPQTSPLCDTLVQSTAMLWGNYDTVNAAVRWNSTEAAPSAVSFVAANFSSSYFSTLAHTLPASLYYASKPSWFASAKAWPPIGPDVSTGNVGVCTGGTMAGAQATTSGQCTSGTLTTAWASHTVSIPAQDCFLNVMGGPADGSGSALAFSASACAAAPTVATPTASPVAGTYAGPRAITLSTTTGGATICYTLDGTTPTTNGAGTCTHGTTYAGAFVINSASITVKAIGTLSGDLDSSILTAPYVISPTLVSMQIAMVGNSTARISAPAGVRSLSCVSTYSDGTTGTCATPSWTSATPSVATINTSGQVTGVVVGQTLIQATIGTIVSNPVNLIVGSGVKWFVRGDGGTNVQCTGHTDAAYPGSGTGVACGVLNDYYLRNQSTGAWTIAAGDEVDYDNSSFTRGLRNAGVGISWPFCGTDGQNCFPPPPPDYTAFIGWCARGANVCQVGTAVGPNPTLALNPTTSWSLLNNIGAGLELDFTTGIDIEGIDITQPATCTLGGITFLVVSNTSMTSGTATYVVSNPGSSLSPVVGEPITVTGTTNGGGVFNITNKQIATVSGTGPWTITVTGLSGTVSSAADTGTVRYALTCQPTDNYGKTGIQMAFQTNQGPTNLTIKNVAIHGLASRGIIGSHYNKLATDVLTVTNLIVDGNGFTGIDADGGGCHDDCNSIGFLNWTNIVAQANGAVEVKPNGGTILGNGFTAAIDQQYNGNGDNIVMIATQGFWRWTNLVTRYGLQDCFDSLHTGDGAHRPTTLVFNIYSEGCEGAAIKLGSGTSILRNFVAIANCDFLSIPSSFPGNPPGWDALTGQTCRAQNATVFSMSGTDNLIVQNGTIAGHQDVNIGIGDIAPTGAGNQCTACTILLQNVASIGFTTIIPQPGAPRQPAGLFMNSVAGTFTITTNHMSWFNMRSTSWTGSGGATGIPCPQANVETNTVCGDPLFTAESNVNAMNIVPLGTSPLLLAGANYTGQPTTDVFGATYSNPLPIGAAMNSLLPTAATPTASPAAGTYGSTQTVTLSTSTSGATICYTTNGSTPASTTAGTCDGGSTTYSGTISVATTTTIKALATKVGDTNSSVASFLYTIVPVVAAPTASPVAGTYATAQSVTLTTSTSGATICFTTDGTTPAATTPGTCSHGTTYSTAIPVTTSQTILALGTKSGDTNSSVSSFAYTIAPLPPTSLHILMNMQGMIAQ